LTPDTIPNTEAARVALHSLARLREALTSPFNTPDRTFDRPTWLRLVHELLLAIHEGLRNAQLVSPDFRIANAFDALDDAESSTGGRIYLVLSALTHFFWSDSKDMICEGFLKTHCFRCIKSANVPPLPETMRSIQLTTELDRRRVRETLLNTTVQDVHEEVDKWREEQRLALISHIVTLITGDPHATPSSISAAAFDVDPRLADWVDRYRDDMHSHVRRTIAGDVQADTIDIWGQEHLATLLMTKRAKVVAEATASFDRQGVWDTRVAEMTAELEKDLGAHRASMVSAGQKLLEAERAALTAAADEEIGRLRNDLCVRVDDEKARGEASVTAAVRRSARLAGQAGPTASNNQSKWICAGKKRKTALSLDVVRSSAKSDTDSGSLYAPSSPVGLASSIHAPSPSHSDPTPTAPAFP
jgi:hypothetical protein